MRLPDALVIGPMKSGTSWIQDYLQARGDVALPNGVKETFFFDRRYRKGIRWYAAHFSQADPDTHSATVEVAPSYFHAPDAPARIHDVLGDIRLIVTLRDPVRRAWSHYLHLRRYGYTRAPLRKAVTRFPEILEASRYRSGLERWRAVFPRDRIWILRQEELATLPEKYAERLCAGLSIPAVAPPARMGKSNEATLPRSFWLAAAGDRTAHFLRERRLYGFVNIAKRLGLKELFFGRPGARPLPTLDEADSAWLAAQLGGEAVDEGEYQAPHAAEWSR